MHTLHKLVKYNSVRWLLLTSMKGVVCIVHVLRINKYASFKTLKNIPTSTLLELLHMYVCGSIHIRSLGVVHIFLSYWMIILDSHG